MSHPLYHMFKLLPQQLNRVQIQKLCWILHYSQNTWLASYSLNIADTLWQKVFLESLSYCRMKLAPIKFCPQGMAQCCKLLYTVQIFRSTPSHYTALFLHFLLVLHLTNILLFEPKASNLDSSVHNTFFKLSTVQCLCSFAYLSLFSFLLFSLRYGFSWHEAQHPEVASSLVILTLVFNGCYLVQLQVDNLWGVFVLNYTLRYELNVIWIVYEMNCIKKIFNFSKLLVGCEERWVKVFLWQKFKMTKSLLWLHSPFKKTKMLTFGNASPIFKADPSFVKGCIDSTLPCTNSNSQVLTTSRIPANKSFAWCWPSSEFASAKTNLWNSSCFHDLKVNGEFTLYPLIFGVTTYVLECT